MKKFISIFIAVVFTLSLAACNNNTSENSGGTYQSNDGTAIKASDDATLIFKNEDSVELGTPEQQLDAEKIYQELTYVPEMFYGSYQVIGGDDKIAEYQENSDYMDYYKTDKFDKDKRITTIPYKIIAGPNTFSNVINNVKKYNWMQAYFYDEKGNLLFDIFAYEIDGNKLLLTPLKDYDYDREAEKMNTYELCDITLSYEFSFKGTSLTLSSNGKSVVLNAGYITGKESNSNFMISNYVKPGDDKIDNIVGIAFHQPNPGSGYEGSLYILDEAYHVINYKNIASMSENGLFTFTIPFGDGTKTYQYVYFYLDNDGIILTDGANTYYYTLPYSQYADYKLSDVVDEGVEIESMSQSDTDDLMKQQNRILLELVSAFKEKNINAAVNEDTGRIELNNDILFDKDSSELSADGKNYLDSFIEVYTSVVLSEENQDVISQILVEGHTDTDGTHEYNQTLSEKRAESVVDYCLSVQPSLKDYIKSKGYSYDNPIYKSDGSVDMDASRRVVFKFLLATK